MAYERLYHPRKDGVRIRTIFGGVIIFLLIKSLYCGRVSYETVIPLVLVGNEMIIVGTLVRSASWATYHLMCNVRSCALLCAILKLKSKMLYFFFPFCKPRNTKLVILTRIICING